MRTSRLTATAALLVLTTGMTVAGTTGAFAADPTSSPSATAEAEPTAAPSATAEATGTPSATTEPSPTAEPTATGTPTPTATPSATATLPEGCTSQRDVKMPVQVSPADFRIVKDGTAQEIAISFQNTSSTTLTDFKLTYRIDSVKSLWRPKSEVKVQNGEWKPANATADHGSVALGTFQVKPNETITTRIRLTVEDSPWQEFYLDLNGASEVLPYGVGPENVKYTCNRLTGSYSSSIKAVDKPTASPSATTAPSSTATKAPTATTAPSTTATASTTASATATATASTSPSPSATRPAGTTGGSNGTGANGTHLANTGANGSTVPLAITGGVAVLLGAGALLIARRRKAARS
ncbi:LPXTG cell wall anchor domain-containing protein [Kitasatospora sp. NPDC008115]|uniref:LPXTG cell wall anchor domain-containing protein n=1 Tax=Kitasatospora sp. NPDC008115 TaxID=3364022 RepID=UPI0036E51479